MIKKGLKMNEPKNNTSKDLSELTDQELIKEIRIENDMKRLKPLLKEYVVRYRYAYHYEKN